MDLTKELLVQASKLALSVIIIGVGKEQFLLMNALDSDGALLRDAQGNAALRDIVQFVKFQDYATLSPAVLAEVVLKEIPEQLVSFMLANNIMPAPTEFAKF